MMNWCSSNPFDSSDNVRSQIARYTKKGKNGVRNSSTNLACLASFRLQRLTLLRLSYLSRTHEMNKEEIFFSTLLHQRSLIKSHFLPSILDFLLNFHYPNCHQNYQPITPRTRVEKYTREDGKFAVLGSPAYGSGWSTRARDEDEESLLFDAKIVKAVLAGFYHAVASLAIM